MRIWILFLLSLGACQKRTDADWRTDYEKSNFLETPRYEKTMEYLRRLEDASPWVKIKYFSTSTQGRKNPLVIVDKRRQFKPREIHEDGRVIILVQAGIHAGEIDGKDAGMMLIRDMLINHKNEDILDNVVLLFMPFFNVDGHERFGAFNRINQNGPKEMGWRVTSQNYNLNRDYMKADAPEMRDWLQKFHVWKPDLFIDCHVTDGADYSYVVTYAIDETYNLTPDVQSWTKRYVVALNDSMRQAGFPMSPYVNLVNDKNIRDGLSGGVAQPRYSTGYLTLNNRPALLLETHMFKDYKSRVEGTYQTILHTMRFMSDNASSLRDAVLKGDLENSHLTGKNIPVDFATDSATALKFDGYKFHYEKSVASDDSIVVWEKGEQVYDLKYYDQVHTTSAADAPYAYIIPQQWTSVIDVLKAHDVKMKRLKKNATLSVHSFQFSNAKWASTPFEGRLMVSFDSKETREEREFIAGDYVVAMNQSVGKIILNLLEPNAPDALIRWGFFNTIFEQKEYGEAYKLEELARSMLKDSTIKREFENQLKNDKAFASNSFARFNWFYQRSPYWDQNVNRYPIAKIMTKEGLPK